MYIFRFLLIRYLQGRAKLDDKDKHPPKYPAQLIYLIVSPLVHCDGKKISIIIQSYLGLLAFIKHKSISTVTFKLIPRGAVPRSAP